MWGEKRVLAIEHDRHQLAAVICERSEAARFDGCQWVKQTRDDGPISRFESCGYIFDEQNLGSGIQIYTFSIATSSKAA